MITEAAGAGQYILPGTDLSAPRIRIVTIEQAMALRDRAVRVPLVQASHKRAAREEDAGKQGALDPWGGWLLRIRAVCAQALCRGLCRRRVTRS